VSNNDVIVLNATLEQRKKQVAIDIKEDDFFEIFSFEQILKNYDLSYEELENGKVGSGDDGGIDGFFMFVNEELVDEDFNPETIKRHPKISLELIQSKQSSTFSETAMDRVISTLIDIFDLSKTSEELAMRYNALLIRKVELFKEIYMSLAGKHPQLSVKFVYASKGNTKEIHYKVLSKTSNLEQLIKSKFAGSDCIVKFIGARELLDAARTEKTYTLQLKFLENYISRGEDNYIVLSKITDYYDFVTDEKGDLRRYIFESNVRDYQGEVEVNKDIKASLQEPGGLDFWYLNNGVTIIASRASIAGKTITLDDIQIVNGLQTTTTIFNFLKENKDSWKDENRGILIRIIVTQDPEARDRIIKATNNQTSIPTASLRATDRIQRDLEDYMLQHGWYYDRRKNYYKNQGKPSNRIISIPYLAQCVMSIVLKEPDNARARPSSLIKQDVDYKRVFDDKSGLQVYLTCVEIIKSVEKFLKDTVVQQEYLQFRFHVGLLLVINLLGRKDYTIPELAALKGTTIEVNEIEDAFKLLIRKAVDYQKMNGGSFDRISKSRDFVNYMLS
jgi:hypothetical protein